MSAVPGGILEDNPRQAPFWYNRVMKTGMTREVRKKMAGPLIFVLVWATVFFARSPAYADMAAVLSEAYTDSGVPEQEQPQAPRLHGVLGVGDFNGERVIGDARRRTVLLPIVLLTYRDRLYWSIAGGGVWLYHSPDRSFKAGAGVKVHPGYKPDDDPDLIGMEQRRTSLDGYMNALWRTPVVNIGAAFYHDIGNVTNGDMLTLRLSHIFPITADLRLTASAGLEWERAKVVNYYYGVRPEEAQPDRPSYVGHDSVNYGFGASAAYRISRSWSLLAGLYATHLSDGIGDSPIVPRRHTKVVFVGAGWTF
jgi:MipA family protein